MSDYVDFVLYYQHFQHYLAQIGHYSILPNLILVFVVTYFAFFEQVFVFVKFDSVLKEHLLEQIVKAFAPEEYF